MERRYSEGGETNKLYKSSSLLSLPARLNLPQAGYWKSNQVAKNGYMIRGYCERTIFVPPWSGEGMG